MLYKNSLNNTYKFLDEYIDLINQHPIMSSSKNTLINTKYTVGLVDEVNEIELIYENNIALVLNYLRGCVKPINGGKFYNKKDYDILLNKMNDILKMYKNNQINVAIKQMKKDFE